MLLWPQETVGMRSNSKNNMMRMRILTPIAQGNWFRVRLQNQCFSEHEVHEPSIHDQDLPLAAKEVGDYRKLLNFLNGSI